MAQPQPEKTLASLVQQYVGGNNSRVAFLNAQITSGEINDALSAARSLHCEQMLRARYLELTRAGFDVQPELSDSDTSYDICLIIAGKFRQLNEHMIMRAISLVREGGVIIVSGAKNIGISSLLKRTAAITDIEERLNKHHAIAFAIRNTHEPRYLDTAIETSIIQSHTRKYITAPGIFSAAKIDPGSKLLVKHLDSRIKGRVADLGAGWGYLSGEAIEIAPDISSIDLYEADWQGVELCKQNICASTGRANVSCHWHDVVGESIIKKFDHVIMNPPFHQGRDIVKRLGHEFIKTASTVIKPGGSLLMVANRHLAYEETLQSNFKSFRVVEETAEFKVISARK